VDAERDSGLRALLNVHSFFSFGIGVSSPRTLVKRAAELGFEYLCLMDTGGVYGSVELASSCVEYGLKPLFGATLQVEHLGETHPLPLLAPTRAAYARLNVLLTEAHEAGSVALDRLSLEPDLVVLSGGSQSRTAALLETGNLPALRDWLELLYFGFGENFYVQLYHGLKSGDSARVATLHHLALELGIPAVAAPEVLFAHEEQFPLCDALTCARLSITVDEPHRLRPANRAGALGSPGHYLERLPYPDAVLNALELARRCTFDLLPERLTPARATVPVHLSPKRYLAQRCREALNRKYPLEQRSQALERLNHELAIVHHLGLENFFLLAAEICAECRSRGIVYAGRGSAAGSVLCYLLDITKVNPLEHDLLFERFLHTGRRSMPDVDLDISSSRRREIIAWVEETYGQGDREAMVCNRITYRLPGAIGDLARALGIPPHQTVQLTKSLGRDFRHLRPHRAREASVVFDEVLGDSPAKEMLLSLLEQVERGFTRHIAPHSGGTVLSALPLTFYSPLETSSGGIRILQFDKDDVEKLGLIKLDLLGLRMLSVLENALEEIERTQGVRLELEGLPDHPRVWWRIGQGDTMALFQIESPAQVQNIVRTKPQNMLELAHQVALIRPGPIQNQSVHPYIRRKQGLEPVVYDHPALEPILKPTLGVLLFQEQILRICVHFAGLSWTEAEFYRKRLTSSEDFEEVDRLREQFVTGAMETNGATLEQAHLVFDRLSAFGGGYGFAQSHAHAFAQHAYSSAYLREFHPAAYLCGVLNHEPGMFGRMTVVQDASRWGVKLLPLCINTSSMMFKVEVVRSSRGKPEQAVRFGLVGVKGLSGELCELVVLERGHKPYTGIRDAYLRLDCTLESLETLALCGGFDALEGRREALYTLTVLRNSVRGGSQALFAPTPTVPALPQLSDSEVLKLNLEFKGLSEDGRHPMDLFRTLARELGCASLEGLKDGQKVRTAGLIIEKQRPPTASGFAFYLLEDRAARAQTVISPQLWDAHRILLRDASVLVVEGIVETRGAHTGIKAVALWSLESTARVVPFSQLARA